MDGTFDLDLDASRIAFRDGEPVGLGNLGVRGEDAWIGGVGVVAAARRSGVGEALMGALDEQARERGVRRVWLEVIVENSGAFALYDKLGYRDGARRGGVVASHRRGGRIGGHAGDSHNRGALAHPRAAERTGSRGRRTPRTRRSRTTAMLAGSATDDATGPCSAAGAAVQLLQFAGEAEPLLRGLGTGQRGVLNLPEDDPAAPHSLRSLGADGHASASTRCLAGAQSEARLERGASRARHAVCLVAAARRERARGRGSPAGYGAGAMRSRCSLSRTAPAISPRDGARCSAFDEPPELIALGPAVRISRRSRMGVPVGVRASLSLALARGGFDLVHGFEPDCRAFRISLSGTPRR